MLATLPATHSTTTPVSRPALPRNTSRRHRNRQPGARPLLAAVAVHQLLLRGLGLVVLGLLDHLKEVGVHFAQQLLHLLVLAVLLLRRLLLLLVLELLLLAPHLALARLQVLLALHLALEHAADGLLLVGLRRGKRLAHLEQRHGAVDIAYSHEPAARLLVALHANGTERSVAHLVRVSYLVLAVEVVPDVYHAIHARDEEHTGAGGAPAAAREVRGVVLGGHDGRLEVLGPDACRPVANGHEELVMRRVALDGVDGPVVLAWALVVDGDAVIRLLVAQVEREHHALLRAHQVLGGPRLRVVLERSAAQHLAAAARVRVELDDVGRLAQASCVPPHHLAVGRD